MITPKEAARWHAAAERARAHRRALIDQALDGLDLNESELAFCARLAGHGDVEAFTSILAKAREGGQG